MSNFEWIDSDVIWEGAIITVGIERFRYADGAEVNREKVWHPGAVAVLAIDDEHVWMTRQPREVVGLTDSLEIPAGKLDVEGEAPLDAAKRELAEEIGQTADEWREISRFFTSAGFSDERIVLYFARGLSDSEPTHLAEDERIEIVRWPLAEIDAAIDGCSDGKSLIALLWLSRARQRGEI